MTRNLLLALIALPLLNACSQEPEQAPVTPELADEATEPELPQAIASLVRTEFEGVETLTFRSGHADLNNDGQDEWLVSIVGPGVCGSGGCPLRIFQITQDGIETKSKLSVTKWPIGLYDSETNGWRDLAVAVGGGGLEYTIMKVPHDGTTYPFNPTMPPAEPSSDEYTTIIAQPAM
ncbi:hypothetical protein [uncultured Erythrobacter sp.]|uniref:hypothetical protein n=1 Tax=uncultured Erythrobacter sp. TaxID=263913 RepID=UPI00262AF894|nr:hypothetical protein [uncultured Erythrobacter sp.]